MQNTFYEFFAGGGMVRAGLGRKWQCLFANDIDLKKAASYKNNWGAKALIVDDIRNIAPDEMPGNPDLIWGSFPCQDLSIAGNGAGLGGDRSGTFWPFIAHIHALKAENRAPAVVALENVLGTLTSHKGQDFRAICQALNDLGYRYGAFVVDAALFVPQSRPRLFIVAVRSDLPVPDGIAGNEPQANWHTKGLKNAHAKLPDSLGQNWLWWDLPAPRKRRSKFADFIEDQPKCVKWHTASETTNLLSMMSEVNLAKVETAKASGVQMVGAIYKRTRYEHGIKVQRAEIRFDELAGCLRTPSGGSSRQLIMIVEAARIRSRLISARETARLMGLSESYQLPETYNEAYHLTGDGVVVPVVRHISKNLFEPILAFVNANKDREIV